MNFDTVQGKSTANTIRICEHFDAVMCKIHLKKRARISKRVVKHRKYGFFTKSGGDIYG